MKLTIKKIAEMQAFVHNNIKQKHDIIGFSLFSAWLLSVPFEGQIFHGFIEQAGLEGNIHITLAILAHFIGLFISGFFIKNGKTVKTTMLISIIACIVGSLFFFLPLSIFWYFSIHIVSFFSGLFVASWGYYFKRYSQKGQRLRVAADVLIYTNLIMILINVIAINISLSIALALSITGLLGALFLINTLETISEDSFYKKEDNLEVAEKKTRNLTPIIILAVFILIITINSGLMYQVVNPAFSHFTLLTSFYWAVPYILALLIIKNWPSKTKLPYILYIALAMIGISYISFISLGINITSYLLINTLMLGAFGVFDLFWWSILGSLLDYYDNPVKVWGIGLSMNVLGILIGGIYANRMIIDENYLKSSIIALIVVLTIIIILPILNNQLLSILKKHAFLLVSYSTENKKLLISVTDFKDKDKLTKREIEVVSLLLQGYTYKAISEELNISSNTIKYHSKNIYQKYNVNSKMELIKKLKRIK